MARSLPWLQALTLGAALAGCTTTEVVEPSRGRVTGPRLVVTRAGPEVTLTWRSDRGARYTVFYSDSSASDARWKPLPGYSGLAGTGGTMSARDQVPEFVKRRYKLDTIPPRAR